MVKNHFNKKKYLFWHKSRRLPLKLMKSNVSPNFLSGLKSYRGLSKRPYLIWSIVFLCVSKLAIKFMLLRVLFITIRHGLGI